MTGAPIDTWLLSAVSQTTDSDPPTTPYTRGPTFDNPSDLASSSRFSDRSYIGFVLTENGHTGSVGLPELLKAFGLAEQILVLNELAEPFCDSFGFTAADLEAATLEVTGGDEEVASAIAVGVAAGLCLRAMIAGKVGLKGDCDQARIAAAIDRANRHGKDRHSVGLICRAYGIDRFDLTQAAINVLDRDLVPTASASLGVIAGMMLSEQG